MAGSRETDDPSIISFPPRPNSEDLEAPDFLGRPRFEDHPTVSERSVGSVGVLAAMALIATAVSLISGQLPLALISLLLLLVSGAGYGVLVRRLVNEQRARDGRFR